MSKTQSFILNLPPSSAADGAQNSIEHDGTVVIVGANGAGKTRLGAWIELESPHKHAVHRVSAQRSLSMPESVSTRNIDEALNELYYGYANASATIAHKVGHRWGGKPSVTLLNDFQRLMVYLFSEEFDESTRYRQEALAAGKWRVPPKTKLDVLREIWQDALPERALTLGGGKVQAGLKDGPPSYSGSDMSDGERVVFYLVGQCLAAPPNAVIVIDEPEIHLHRAIQSRLWNLIEARRPDCQFVYVTHDVDFAASRHGAVKVWLKSYDGAAWEWSVVPLDQGMPEALLLELIGSRKPVLFVEGDRESIDGWIYAAAYPEFTVVPNGSCEAVIHNVAAFRRLKALHALDCYGLVDRDHRSEEELQGLANQGVFATEVAQVENLFLTEATLEALCQRLSIDDVASVLNRIRLGVFARAAESEGSIVNGWTQAALHRRLRRIAVVGENRAEFEMAVASVGPALDVATAYDPAQLEVRRVLEERDYEGLLRFFKQKGLLPSQLAPGLGLAGKDILDTLKRLVVSTEGQFIRAAIRAALPRISAEGLGTGAVTDRTEADFT